MNSVVKKLKDELDKEDKTSVDFDKCLSILEDIEGEIEYLEDDIEEYESQVWDLREDIGDLKYEISELGSVCEERNIKTIDDEFKERIFKDLSNKYTPYQLEELLKNNNIL